MRDVELLDRREAARSGAVMLGGVEAEEAVEFLLELARDGRGGVAEDAVFPAVLADVDQVWEPLLELARDRDARSGARKSALFWVGQEAAEAATRGLVAVAGDDDEDQDLRDAAIFALSQRPDAESIPALMELARTADRGETRRTALFWLAQSDDPEVVEFFAEILRGSGVR